MKKVTQKDIANTISKVAKAKVKHPSLVTKSELQKFDPTITDWTLKTLGGIAKIKNANFPVDNQAMIEIEESIEMGAYVRKLEKQLANKTFTEEKLLEAVSEHLKPLPKINPPKFKASSTVQKREIVGMLNDTHYGLIVNPDEIGDVNSYGWHQACRRTAMVLCEMLGYKPHHRDQVKKVHLVLNGDLIQGIIHGLTTKQMELSIFQINGAVHILTHVIANLAKEFAEVEVTGICGNHEDALHKREHGKRVSQEKYDSYANIIYYALSTAFRESSHVKFNFPKTPYAYINLPAGRCMVNHGDTLFSKALGYPGTSINVKSLGDEIRKFNAGEVAKGRAPIKLMLFGHTHTFAHFITSDGVEVYVAPSLSGLDSYAHSLNINDNTIGQVVFESTERFILGDSRLVRLTEADTNKELDKLIPIYSNSLKWSK